MPSTQQLDSAVVESDAARAFLAAEVAAQEIGEHVGCVVEDEHVVTHHFASTNPAYAGWFWSVTMVRAGDAADLTLNEIVLLPGESSIVAPSWVPWNERLQPGDLSPGDLLPVADDDARLVPTYLVGDEIDPDERVQVRRVAEDLGLGRVRTLSLEGLESAAQRWYDGDGGPESPLAKSAPEPCYTCGFLVRLSGSLSDTFGVCANGNANDDGRIVTFNHGCGAHSEVKLARRNRPLPLPEHVFDSMTEVLEEF